MNIYPQLSSGALSQFPIVKKRSVRTVVNAAADGSSIKYADLAAETVEWQLQYAGIGDGELAALDQFFTAAEGSLNGFTFLDPNGNLLAWSEDLGNAVWTPDPFLAVAAGAGDPLGGTNGWHLSNSGAAGQSITQILNAPVAYTYSFSVYSRGAHPMAVALVLGSQRAERILDTNWGRISIVGSGDASASSIGFGIEAPAGAAIDVFGPQVEAQRSPSAYKTGTTGGVYENARFRDDTFTFTSTDVNCNTATVNIFYAKHL
jgi:hypothetical protein